MKTAIQTKKLNGAHLKIGIVVARFHSEVTEGLLQGALKALKECKVPNEQITVLRVPGCFEVPLALQRLLGEIEVDALVALGALVKGETRHDEYLATAVTHAIQQLILSTGKPIGFGIITALTLEQAMARSRETLDNRGLHAAYAAVEMAISL